MIKLGNRTYYLAMQALAEPMLSIPRIPSAEITALRQEVVGLRVATLKALANPIEHQRHSGPARSTH